MGPKGLRSIWYSLLQLLKDMISDTARQHGKRSKYRKQPRDNWHTGLRWDHGACWLCIKKALNQAKIYQGLVKMVSITLEGLWMVCDKIVDFRFFVKFHRSGPAIIFSF